jgi:glutamine synthetase
LWFADILGQVKSFSLSDRELENALRDGMGFDGSSVEGFARIYESDLIAKPDPATFSVLPWSEDGIAVGKMFCDIEYPDGKPYEGDGRYVLKKQIERVKKQGYKFYVGPELEFFYFKNEQNPEFVDRGGYFDYVQDRANSIRRKTILQLERLGMNVEYSHHEVAPSQHEIDLRYDEALLMADNVLSYKIAVKQVALEHGLHATFMPKPLQYEAGSGMHVHQSLFEGDKNIFYDAKDEFFLSPAAKHYIAGVMNRVKEMCVVTNQWVNSYKRLVPGYEAPVYISWARKNRSALIRVPMYKPGREKATRIELRFPDPACNPYLAFTVMLAAGLDGIANKARLSAPVETDIFHMSGEERKKHGIDSLPGSLWEAVEYAEKSDFLRKALGDHIYYKLLENKKIEWDIYRKQITPFEIKKYLPIL